MSSGKKPLFITKYVINSFYECGHKSGGYFFATDTELRVEAYALYVSVYYCLLYVHSVSHLIKY